MYKLYILWFYVFKSQCQRKGTKKDGTKEKVVVDLVNGKIK